MKAMAERDMGMRLNTNTMNWDDGWKCHKAHAVTGLKINFIVEKK